MIRDLSLNVLPPASPEWISGRVETLLSHFHSQTSRRPNVEEAAMMDWIFALRGFTQSQISAACREWIKSQKWRPTPHDIRSAIKNRRKNSGGNCIESLSPQEAATANAIIADARRHVEQFAPGTTLHEHALATLRYWGQE